MRQIRRLATVAAAAAVVAAGGVAAATPASAHSTCPAGYHCVFYAGLGNGPRYAFFSSDGKFSDNYFSNGATVNNNTIAASNSSTGGYESHYYASAGYTGEMLFCVNPGHATPYALPINLQNEASSLRLRSAASVSCY